jgi:CO/xanthine dehydrogenase Mo-binding subunit
MVAYQVIGKYTPRVDGVEKVTGAAHYTADFALPGTIWGKVLHSPYAHARIVRIDTSAAKALPGVHAVLTGEDVHTGGLYGRRIRDIPVLAYERVRFVGERVAAVAADDKDTAQRALDLIEVEYEELPAVFDPMEAMADGAPVLHPDFPSYAGGAPQDAPTNKYSHTSRDVGDPDTGFAAADVVIENTYTTSRVHQAYLESHAVLVSVEGRVQVWCTSKAPYNMRESLAIAAGIPEESVVLNHAYIGGDFGGKGTSLDLPVCYFLAKASGRPVRMVPDYVEEFMAGNPRHATVIRLRTGVKRDGTITAHHVQFYVNCGAYAGYKPGGTIGGANQAAGPYGIVNQRIESIQVYTNTVPGGHMRAPGEPQAAFAIESHIDEVARAIGMDPLDLRIKNLAPEGEAHGEHSHAAQAIGTLHAAAEASGYHAARPAYVGRGIAMGDRGPGGGQGNAAVTLREDGTILLNTPIFDQGTGTYTTLRQVVAEEFQVAPEKVEIEVWNTDAVSFDSGIGGSRGTRVNAAVAYEAAQNAKRDLLQLAASQMGWPEDNLTLRGDEIRRADIEESVRWTEVVARAGGTLAAEGHIQEGRADVTAFTSQVAEVAVDPETGEITVLKFTTAHDVGTIFNPVGHQGQVNGGFMQGLGYALMEELRVEDGRVTSLSFGDYKIPTMGDLPQLKTVLVQADSGVGPYQLKGIGESPISPVAPAIANAIEDAIGVRIRDLPITAEKVYQALKAKNST